MSLWHIRNHIVSDNIANPVSLCFQAGICFCSLIYTYFRVPEPTGKSFAELDLLFEQKVSARKFAKTNLDVFGTDESERAALAIEHKDSKQKVEHLEKV